MPAPYPLEFRREAVELLKRSGKSVPQLALELGVSPQLLRNWSRQIDINDGRAEVAEQRRARGAAPAPAQEPDAHRGARDLEKSGGLLRQGRRDPVTTFRF